MHFSIASALVQILAQGCLSTAGAPTGHPRNYAAPQATAPIVIDGNIYKKAWEGIPWSDDFVEIRGADAPEAARPTSKTRTRMKMTWTDEFLYIAAEMSASDWPITAEYTNRNDPIFHKDSDFEVFLDTDGSNNNYKELEMNARNTVWNILMDKPYSDGGAESSGRVARSGDAKYWDVTGQKTAAKMYGLPGKAQPDGKWTAEIALSHKDSLDRTTGSAPAVGKFWRINFSRVEKKGAVNWVWSPQMVWTPAKGKYEGKIDMHAPDAWGYVVFTEAGGAAGTQQDWADPNWKVKAAAHQVFHAEKYASGLAGGGKLLSPEELLQKNLINATLVEGLDGHVTVTQTNDGWTARIDTEGCVTQIDQDRLVNQFCSSPLFGVFSPMHVIVSLVLLISIGICWAFSHMVKPKPSSASV